MTVKLKGMFHPGNDNSSKWHACGLDLIQQPETQLYKSQQCINTPRTFQLESGSDLRRPWALMTRCFLPNLLLERGCLRLFEDGRVSALSIGKFEAETVKGKEAQRTVNKAE